MNCLPKQDLHEDFDERSLVEFKVNLWKCFFHPPTIPFERNIQSIQNKIDKNIQNKKVT